MRIVLQITVHGDNDLPAGMIKPGGHRGGLAKIAAQAHRPYPGILLLNGFKNLQGLIPGAVIGKHDLRLTGHGVKHACYLFIEQSDIFFLVIERNNYGNIHTELHYCLLSAR